MCFGSHFLLGVQKFSHLLYFPLCSTLHCVLQFYKKHLHLKAKILAY
jgi:hypothetical protein